MNLFRPLSAMIVVALLTGCFGSNNSKKVAKADQRPSAVGTANNNAPAPAVQPAPAQAPAAKNTPPPAAPKTPTIPGQTVAKVVMVKTEMQFVVLEFSTSDIPSPGSQLTLYRGKDRVAAVKVTEPIRPPFVTADILDGNVNRGDEVR